LRACLLLAIVTSLFIYSLGRLLVSFRLTRRAALSRDLFRDPPLLPARRIGVAEISEADFQTFDQTTCSFHERRAPFPRELQLLQLLVL
jgi:CHASE2 domain-containing sensor protein